MRDGGHQRAAGALLAVEPGDRRVDVGRELGQLAATAHPGADVAAAEGDGGQRLADRLDVAHGARGEQVGDPEPERRGPPDEHRGEERVVAGDEHPHDEHGHDDRRLGHDEQRERGELAAQPAEGRPPRHEHVPRRDG